MRWFPKRTHHIMSNTDPASTFWKSPHSPNCGDQVTRPALQLGVATTNPQVRRSCIKLLETSASQLNAGAETVFARYAQVNMGVWRWRVMVRERFGSERFCKPVRRSQQMSDQVCSTRHSQFLPSKITHWMYRKNRKCWQCTGWFRKVGHANA